MIMFKAFIGTLYLHGLAITLSLLTRFLLIMLNVYDLFEGQYVRYIAVFINYFLVTLLVCLIVPKIKRPNRMSWIWLGLMMTLYLTNFVMAQENTQTWVIFLSAFYPYTMFLQYRFHGFELAFHLEMFAALILVFASINLSAYLARKIHKIRYKRLQAALAKQEATNSE